MSTNAASFQCPCTKHDLSGGRETGCIHADGLAYPQSLVFNPNQLNLVKLAPDWLRTMNASDLIALGYTVEKSVGKMAFEIRQVVKARANETPWPTFRFAMTHKYFDIADAAAPYTIGRLPTKEQCIHDLALADQLAWYEYREQYLLLLDAVFAQPPAHKNTKRKLHDCGGWEAYAGHVLGNLTTMSLFMIMSEVAEHGASVMFARGRWEKEVIPPGWEEECVICRERADKWESAVSRRFRRLETFGTILERVRSGPGNG